MSIPRTAIHRPVTMFMISTVIVLLGAISLIKLPVDLMPDVNFPSLTVRVSGSRSQARNRAEATRLLEAKLEDAAAAAREIQLAEAAKNRRRKAKRSRAAKRRLVESKRRRSETKQLRRKVG